MPPLGCYALVIVIAAVVTAVVVIPVRRTALKVGYVALPDERKVHHRITPYGGGAAMLIGACVAMAAAALMHPLHPVFSGSSEPLGVVLAAAAIFFVGFVDDRREMSAPA
ncbi:MAG: undecaprenyl/decaprenyl-phosphate alpha-N-acetylglucosaminyl 1-phosphate transferase, partial [Actinobacteria bacterium]|nr:undecaprenyl/decaprenyl-phosphate alpha-N-acetylglucosaminyl 1-phosphate transferase [Actinomycetota bacterium]